MIPTGLLKRPRTKTPNFHTHPEVVDPRLSVHLPNVEEAPSIRPFSFSTGTPFSVSLGLGLRSTIPVISLILVF